MSNSFPLNPLTLTSGLVSGRSNTPPSSQSQQQSSPNSFLQGLSSRLRSQQQMPLSSSGYQSGQGSTSVGGGFGTSGLSGQGSGGRSVMDIFDSANIPGPGLSAGSFGFRGSSAGGGNNFGIPVSSGPPSTFDINEFPSLSGSGGGLGNSNNSILPSSAPGSNRPNYVGQLVKDVHASIDSYHNKPTFDMNEYDFPALPGSGAPGSEASRAAAMAAAMRNSSNESSGNTIGSNLGHGTNTMMDYQQIGGLAGDLSSNRSRHFDSVMDRGPLGNANLPPANMTNVTKSGKKGIVTTKEGKVSNIPMGMVTDQFGMIGLLTFIRAAETEQNIVSLALGTDLTSLKLDLNSSDTLYSTFPGPWSETPLKPHEIDYPVPAEYLIHHQVRDKLASIREKLSRYGDDTLFFLFYMFPNDLLQIGAANELWVSRFSSLLWQTFCYATRYVRDWRYHKDDKVWVTRAPGMPPVEKTTSYERGTYYFFDPTLWRRVAKEFHLDYERLENKPASTYLQAQLVNNNASGNSGSSGGGTNLMSAWWGSTPLPFKLIFASFVVMINRDKLQFNYLEMFIVLFGVRPERACFVRQVPSFGDISCDHV